MELVKGKPDHYYRKAKPAEFVPGLMHVNLGGYHIRDIEFTAAFDVVDTGGIDPSLMASGKAKEPLSIGSADYIEQIRAQAEMAVHEADAVLFVTDADNGVTPADREVAQILRRHQAMPRGRAKKARAAAAPMDAAAAPRVYQTPAQRTLARIVATQSIVPSERPATHPCVSVAARNSPGVR